MADATRLAFELRLTVYDALYVALAARLGGVCVTADRKLHAAVRSHAQAAGLVAWVGAPQAD
jgi:predicted nucleic acid-binding protein